jgi:O-antigen ligase
MTANHTFQIKNYIFLITIVLLLAGNSILNRHTDYLLLMMILWGAFLYRKSTPMDGFTKLFTLGGYFFLIFISLSIFFYNNIKLYFDWQYDSYRWLAFIPLIIPLLKVYSKDSYWFWLALSLSAIGIIYYELLLLANLPLIRGEYPMDIPILRGNMGMLFGIILLIVAFQNESRVKKILLFISSFVGVWISIQSGSRGGWLAYLLALLTTAIFLSQNHRKKMRYLVLYTIFIFGAITIFWEQLPISDRLQGAYSDVLNYYYHDKHLSSVGSRLELFKSSYYSWLEKPFFGWGWDQFSKTLQINIDNGLIKEMRIWGHPHNYYFLLLVELGLIGFLIFMFFFLTPAIRSLQFLIRNKKAPNKIRYVSLLIIVMTEAIAEFMLSNDTMTRKYFVYTFVLVSLWGMLIMHNHEKSIKNNAHG